jgi:ESF2/ABP1 family protein
MKYLRGFKWADLMEQIQRERGERGARKRIEDAKARKEEKVFLVGVERGKAIEGIRKKREAQGKKSGAGEGAGGEKITRVFKQNKVRGRSNETNGVTGTGKLGEASLVDADAERILAKIF